MRISFLLLLTLYFYSCSTKNQNIIYNGENVMWTENFNEIELVMSYVLDVDDYKKLKKLNQEEKSKYLDIYWSEIDPDKSTVKNELLDELNDRVIESKELFKGIDGGLLSDRAKVYIMYGPPDDQYKTSSYSNNNTEILIWKFKSGYEFNFILDTFGRYRLVTN